jgi:nitrilase
MTVKTFSTVRVAAVQAAPVFLNTPATIDKLESLVAEASSNGAMIVAFGESFISGFPIWCGILAPIDQHDYQVKLVESAIEVPGPEIDRLASIARKYGVCLSVGVNEVSANSVGQVWNANLIFDPSGELINHRRKLVATWAERLVWSHGDGYDLEPVAVEGVKLGALLCGENTNTLARYALLAQGEEVHIAAYPPSWPFDRNVARGDYNLAENIRLRAAAHSFEGKVFSIVASTALGEDAIAAVAGEDESLRALLTTHPTASMILGPTGTPMAGPLIGDEGILYATLDTKDRIIPKQAQDIVGTYNRFDVFSLTLNKTRHTALNFTGTPKKSELELSFTGSGDAV